MTGRYPVSHMDRADAFAAFKPRMVNWARYVRDTHQLAHCFSMEHRYVPARRPHGNEETVPGEKPHGLRESIDYRDGEHVRNAMARAVENEMLTRDQAWALTFHFVFHYAMRSEAFRWSAARRCRVFHINRLEKLITKSIHVFMPILDWADRAGMIHADSLNVDCASSDPA